MRHPIFSSFPLKPLAVLSAAMMGAMALTGCGVGAAPVAQDEVANIPAMTVKVMGGETPVFGSTVTLWETDPGNTGYGLTARAVETATVQGELFQFATGYSCTHSSDFLYVTATGGDTSGGTSSPTYNPNLVLMAALGSCANLSTATQQGAVYVIVNELSTVAAAYALGNFMTVVPNGSVGTQKVYIGAPAANNATTGSCTGTGSSMTCTAAGLAHAFANALNLVNNTNAGGLGGPTAQANTTVPGNSLGSVPQAEINTLGNIMQFCTNTGNPTSTSSTISANCSTFFADATGNGAAPTDTLTAMVNIAHFPQHNVGSSCTGTPATTGGLFCLSSTYASFTPFLSAAPHDWAIGIAYSGTTGTSGGSFGLPQYLTLDANDNVYVQTGNAHTPTTTGLAAMSSSGAALWTVAQTANLCAQGVMATDTNSNVFLGIYETTATSGSDACTYGIYGFSTATGAQTYQFAPGSGTVCGQTTPSSTNCPGFPSGGYDTVHPVQSATEGIAIDRYNNLWYSRRSTTCANCMLELPYTSASGYGAATTTEGFSGADWNAGYELVIDSTGNVYSSTLGSVLDITPNTNPTGTPTYVSSTTSANQGYVTQNVGGTSFGTIALDSAGNLWSAYSGDFVEFTPSYTSGVISGYTTASTSPYAATFTAPHVGEFDGHDNLFVPQFSTTGTIYMQTSPSYSGYNSSNINAFTVVPCYAPAAATTCAATPITSDPHVVQIDSTGSMWIAGTGSVGGNPADVVQVIGTAYPTWPQLSYGKFGVTPQ